ncbi:hypothetical protein V3N99_21790 [Dermatophilaceae bacterium Soc4.6]
MGWSGDREDSADEHRRGIEQLEQAFVLVNQWQTAPASMDVQPRSTLAGDDTATAPFQTSHMARHSLGVAVDHLHCLRAAILGADSLHAWAPFTLLRSAIESAAVAAYLLGPAQRNERVLRRLMLVREDDLDREAVDKLLGTPTEPWMLARLARLREIAGRRPGLDPMRIGPRSKGYAAKVSAGGDATVFGGEEAVFMWRICSGLAHGKQWATHSMLGMHRLEQVAEGVHNVRITSDASTVATITDGALALVLEAQRIYSLRATSPDT